MPEVKPPPAQAELLTHFDVADPVIANLARAAGRCELDESHAGTCFQHLASAIASQQISGLVARKILDRLIHAHDGEFPTPTHIHSATTELLRGVGFSFAKVAALKDLAAKTLDGTVPEDEAAHAARGRRADRTAGAGARHRHLDGADAAHVPPAPRGRAADRRLRGSQGVSARVWTEADAAAESAARVRRAVEAVPLRGVVVFVASSGAACPRRIAGAHRKGATRCAGEAEGCGESEDQDQDQDQGEDQRSEEVRAQGDSRRPEQRSRRRRPGRNRAAASGERRDAASGQ